MNQIWWFLSNRNVYGRKDIWSSSDVEAALSGLKIEIFIKDPKCVNKLEYNGKSENPWRYVGRWNGHIMSIPNLGNFPFIR